MFSKRKKEQHIIHVRSKDASQLDDNLNTHFIVSLTSPIMCRMEDTVHATIGSVEIPHSFYCISKVLKNNTIYWRDVDGDNLYLLPEQNYTIPVLLKILNENTPFNFSYNEYTNKLTISNLTDDNLTILWTKSGCSNLLGFKDEPDNLLLPNDFMTPLGIIDLATIHSIMIKSDLASGCTQSTRAGQSSTLQKIAIDVEPWGIIYLKEGSYRTKSTLSKSNINIMTFRLTDQNDNLLDLNKVNFEFTVIIDVIPAEDTPYDNLASMRPTIVNEADDSDEEDLADVVEDVVEDIDEETILDVLMK